MTSTMPVVTEHTLRVKLCDALYERVCTEAVRRKTRPETVVQLILERGVRRLPASSERAA
jgi:hypothetical protein